MKNWIPTLNKILRKARISPNLCIAIDSTIKALEAKDLDLAYQITACKSLIIGSLEPKNKQYAFQEDHAYNKARLKDSVYGLLDGIHHDIAWQINKMPSGQVMALSNGKICEMTPTGIHPVVKRIKLEKNRIHREVRNPKPKQDFTATPTRKVNWRKP